MEHYINKRAEIHPGITGCVDVILTCLQLFELLSPKELIKVVFIPFTIKNIMDEGGVLTYGGFLVWIGIWFIMDIIQGFQLCAV